MFAQQSLQKRRILVLVIGLFVCAWDLSASTALGQFSGGGGGRHGGGGRDRVSADDAKPGYKPLPAVPGLTFHGGEYVSTETNYYEVVYMPLQTRIYLFDTKLKPLSAREMHALMTVQLPTENAPRQVPFQYVAMPVGVGEQDFVMALCDIRPLEGKETSITLEFSGLADRHNPTASFTPYYSRFKMRPYVMRVLLAESDRDAVARQGICPVSGVPLGSQGPVVKLYVADFPLFVAGDECIAAVKESPQKFLPRALMPAPAR